jgi:predicted Zn-dependent protease
MNARAAAVRSSGAAAARSGGAAAARRALAVALCLLAGSGPAPAQPRPDGKGLPIIRDAEIEELLREYTAPILRVAGLAKQNVQIVVINARAFNAFVADGRRIFVNVGAILDSKTPNQLIGVFAHETGHLAGGHLIRMRQELANAQTMAVIALLAGVGAMVAGAQAGAGSSLGQVGPAALMGSQSMIQRSLLSYQRAQEEQADRAGVKFLSATGQSARGMYETFSRIADQSMFLARSVDPYLQTHPMPAERVRALEVIARTSPYWDRADPPALQLRHDMMRAKISAFIEPAQTVANRYPLRDTSLPARYARAIAAYRYADLRTALPQIDALIHEQPNNPYFHELKGQALIESGRAAEAIAPLRRAVAIAPKADLIRVMLAQALTAVNNARSTDEAIALLRGVLIHDPDLADGYRHLAMAYGRKGDIPHADLASAQAAFASGEYRTARQLAERAKRSFPTGSPGWVRADDIASYKPPSSTGVLRPQ